MFAKGFFSTSIAKKKIIKNISIGFNINIKSRPTDDVGKAYTNACSEEIFGVHKKKWRADGKLHKLFAES